jgi:hypothetical protein
VRGRAAGLVLVAMAWAGFAVPDAAHSQTAASLVTQDLENAKCNRPDHRLIRRETSSGIVWSSETSAPSRYNDQAREFNDCTRRFVIDADRQINVIRTDARERLDRTAADATSQIRVIEAQITAAVDAVRNYGPYAPPALPASFPDPDCKPVTNEQAYEKCMHDWIDQAKSEIRQINADTHVAMAAMAADANRQIHEINVTIIAALAEVHVAIKEQASALSELKPSTLPSDAPPGTESVIVNGPEIPRSADMPTGAGDPGAISCRAPQMRADSRLPSPEVCKRNREWALIFQRGENLAPDGVTIVSGEKERTYNPQTCITTHSVTGLPTYTMNCSRGP